MQQTPYSSQRVVFNTLWPRRNGRLSADGTFKCTSLNEYVLILMKISLKYLPWGQIHNKLAMFQIMVWRQTGDKSLSEPKMA